MKRFTALLVPALTGLFSLVGCDKCCSFRSSDSSDENVAQTSARATAVTSIVFHNDNFQSEVLESEKPVLVDFWAPWCGVCKSMETVVAAVAQHFDGKVTVGKLNVDDNKVVARRYDVELLPQFLLFKDGELIKRLGGPLSQEEMVTAIDSVLRGDGETP